MPLKALISLCMCHDAVGRINRDMLSDQMRMELVLDGLQDFSKQRFQSIGGAYMRVCEWPGVTCDASQRVTAF